MIKTFLSLLSSSPSNPSDNELGNTKEDILPQDKPNTTTTTKKKLRNTLLLSGVIFGILIFLIAMLSALRKGMRSQTDQVLSPITAYVPTIAPIAFTMAPVITVSSVAPSRTAPTTSPLKTAAPTSIMFDPGNLVPDPHGLLLSVGLHSRIVARSGQRVMYNETMGTKSSIPFHTMPDMGATFVDSRPNNPGGWIYVSNCEQRRPWYKGGVGAITFNARGDIVDYRMILSNTTANCGGGVTPWGSYVTGEEYREGLFWQVDPTGERPPEILTVGKEGGMYESFAADPKRNQFFVTEDFETGPVRRYIPSEEHPDDPWNTLHGDGETTYLRLKPTTDQEGFYEWISDKSSAQSNAQALFPNCEGIDVNGDQLYFISKKLETVFVLDLEGNTYSSYTTRQGLFQGQPDQMIPLQHPDGAAMYFFTEDGSASAGVHARTSDGTVLTILEGPTYSNEVTGLAFSPDNTRMYIAFQDDGILFEIVRDDGLPFTARSLNLRYHSSALDHAQ